MEKRMKNPVKDVSDEKEAALNKLRKLKDFRPSQGEIDVTIVDRDLEREIDEIEHELYPNRVLRGGYWYNNPSGMQASYRYFSTPSGRYYDIGFRIAKNGKKK
jgi:hypothetical protein